MARKISPIAELRAGEMDALAAQVLLDVYSGEGFTPREIAERAFHPERIRAAGGRLFFAEGARGDVAGVVVYLEAGSALRQIALSGEAEFRLLAVAKPYRGKGIAQRLVQHCIRLAQAAGAARLVLSTQKVKMTAAQKLYEGMGFVRVPARDWVSPGGVDFLVYAWEWAD